jgi:hypothetical protein
VERDTIALISDKHNLRSEGGADELRLLGLGDGVEERSNGSTVLRVQIGVNLVEDDEGTRFGGLEGEDEAQGAQTWIGLIGVFCEQRVTGNGILFWPPLSC